MMFDAGILIIDRMIELLRVREGNRKKIFETFVQPLFQDMSEIHKDYSHSRH